MSLPSRSPTGAVTSSPLRRKIETERRIQSQSSETSQSSESSLFSGGYARVRTKLSRAVSVLAADDELSLPQVSVNALERAVSTFLDEIRLGLPRVDSSGRGISSTEGRYGRKLQTEIVDAELARRVRKNRRDVENDIQRAYLARSRK